MAITFLPEEYTPIGALSKSIQPYLQMAMQAQFQRRLAEEEMKRKLQMEEQQRQQATERVKGFVPELFKEYGQIQRPEMIQPGKVPKQFLRTIDIEKAKQYPGLDLESMGFPYKVPQPQMPMGIYTVSPEGIPTQTATLPKGSRTLTPSQLETPEAKQKREIEIAQKKAQLPTADIRNLAKQSELQLENVKALKLEASNLPGGYKGIGLRGIAIATRGAKGGDLYAYERKLPAFAAGLYRALTGDNRLSDMDAQQRALPLLWNTSIDSSLREPMFQFLENALKIRKRLLEQGNYTIIDGMPYTPLEQILQEAQSIQQFNINGKNYNIPLDRVEEFKRDMGLK